MNSLPLLFQLPNNIGILELSPQVLNHFDKHKQKKWLSCEAGGQLFAEIIEKPFRIRITEVTGPRKTDRRSVFGYVPDRDAEKVEIAERYLRNIDFVGDWHTHPQKIPIPSSTDESSMFEMVQQSNYDLPGLLMIIIGQSIFPEGIHVSFYSKASSVRLTPIASSAN